MKSSPSLYDTVCNSGGPGPWFESYDDHPTEKNPFFKDGKGDEFWPFGEGPPGSTSCQIFKGDTPGASSHTFYFPKGHKACGGITGEPHLSTFDDVRYDLQAAGEFIAVKSLDDDLEVQLRIEPWGRGDTVSTATAAAVRVGRHRVTVTARSDTLLRLDGEPVELAEGHLLRSDDGEAAIIRTGWRFSIVWPDGTNVHVDLIGQVSEVDATKKYVNVFVLAAEPRDGRLVGLLGDADGDNGGNDFRTRDGRALASPPELETLYGDFAESWRVGPGESLFDYEPGESTATFTLRDHPRERVTIDDLDPAERVRAAQRCRAAGVREPDALEDCVFDVALTGDETFIASALSLQTPAKFREVNDEVVIEAPAAAFAAHSVEVRISGPVLADHWVGFAPMGSANTEFAANPYSNGITIGGEQVFALIVPTTPGDYELRYREQRGEVMILDHQPFQSVAPQLSIEAPLTAPAGGKVEVRLLGDVGRHMRITVVAAGSPDTQIGNAAPGLEQGTDVTRVIPRLPNEAGEYEIRCMSNWPAGFQVYARRALTIE